MTGSEKALAAATVARVGSRGGALGVARIDSFVERHFPVGSLNASQAEAGE